MQAGSLPEPWVACANWVLIKQITVVSVAYLPRLSIRELCEGGEVRGRERTSSPQAGGKQDGSRRSSLQAAAATVPACLILPVYKPLLSCAGLWSWTGVFNRDAVVPAVSQNFSLLIFGSWWTTRALESHRDCWKGQITVYSGEAGSFFTTVPSPVPLPSPSHYGTNKMWGENFKSPETISCQNWIFK